MEARLDQRENQRISTRADLEVLNSVDLIMTTSTRDSECVIGSERESENEYEKSLS